MRRARCTKTCCPRTRPATDRRAARGPLHSSSPSTSFLTVSRKCGGHTPQAESCVYMVSRRRAALHTCWVAMRASSSVAMRARSRHALPGLQQLFTPGRAASSRGGCLPRRTRRPRCGSRAFCRRARPVLRMQVGVADAASAGLFEQAAQNRCADATTAQTGKYRYAADLTRRIKSPGANWVTVQVREHMDADGVIVVPFVGFRHFLLFNEDGASYALQYGPVGVPGREHTFYVVGRHGAPQRSRASASARPVYMPGLSASRRRRASSGSPRPATKADRAAASIARPRVNSLSLS